MPIALGLLYEALNHAIQMDQHRHALEFVRGDNALSDGTKAFFFMKIDWMFGTPEGFDVYASFAKNGDMLETNLYTNAELPFDKRNVNESILGKVIELHAYVQDALFFKIKHETELRKMAVSPAMYQLLEATLINLMEQSRQLTDDFFHPRNNNSLYKRHYDLKSLTTLIEQHLELVKAIQENNEEGDDGI